MTNSGELRRRSTPEETARRVLEAAAAEFVERGYDGAVISDIARRAGVSSGAIYPRWPHKNDLMLAAIEHLLEQLQPERRIEELGLGDLTLPELFQMWGASLLTSDSVRDVLGQVFGSARSNAAIQQRLQHFLDEQADEFCRLVEQAKDEGSCSPEHETAALALLIHSIGIGTHLLLSGGLSDRYVPSQQGWIALLAHVINGLAPPTDPNH